MVIIYRIFHSYVTYVESSECVVSHSWDVWYNQSDMIISRDYSMIQTYFPRSVVETIPSSFDKKNYSNNLKHSCIHGFIENPWKSSISRISPGIKPPFVWEIHGNPVHDSLISMCRGPMRTASCMTSRSPTSDSRRRSDGVYQDLWKRQCYSRSI